MVTHYWLAVTCAGLTGPDAAFARLPLHRLGTGDGIVLYAPSSPFIEGGGHDRFTAIGIVGPGGTRKGAGSAVNWLVTEAHPAGPLLDWLDFAQTPDWRQDLRSGLMAMPEVDFDFLQHVMTRAWAQTA